MVAKITSGSSAFGVLKYNFDKVEAEKATVLLTNNIYVLNNKGDPDVGQIIQNFETYLCKKKRGTDQTVFHVSLNPHPDDCLNDEQLKKIAQEYMKRLGYNEQPYIIFKHSDIDREHIHIVSLRINAEGKKINDSFEHQHSKQITESLEKKYGLHPVTSKQDAGLELKKVDYNRGDLKKQIGGTVKELLKTYRFQSLNEFRTLLSLFNVSVEEVKGEADGKKYTGLVYSALNQKGEKVGNPFKASLWGKTIGLETIQRIENSAIILKEKPGLKERMKREISQCMRTAKNRADFEKTLHKTKGIQVVFRENEQGRIYGVTFINHRDRIVLNGSKLGKEFSANNFTDLFNNPGKMNQQQERYRERKEEQQEQKEKDISGFTHNKAGNDFFDLFSGGGYANNEQMRIEKEKKKKRRKIR